MIKVIFIDIDGTLRTSEEKITKRTKEAIKKALNKGVSVVITTGRDYEFAKRIGIEAGAEPYIMCSNGGLIINYETEEIIHQDKMPFNLIKTFIDYAVLEKTEFYINAGTKRYSNKPNHKKDIFIDTNQDINVYKNDLENAEQMVIERRTQKEVLIAKEYVEAFPEVVVSNYAQPNNPRPYINISNKNVSKARSIKIFCKYFNIPIEETMSIGDGTNDISMLKTTKHKVAMGNAIPELKQVATEITDTNDNDGVAKAIEKILTI